MTAATAAAVSQELSPFGRALGASRPGTKYPVRGIPHFDLDDEFLGNSSLSDPAFAVVGWVEKEVKDSA